MIEVLRLATGKLLISAGVHSIETEADDASIDRAIDELASRSGEMRSKIAVVVARWQLADV